MVTPTLCPEMRLLLSACHVGGKRPVAPVEACDPASLVRLAAYHRVSALVYEARERIPLPAQAVAPLRAAMLATLHRNLQNAVELRSALRALNAAGIPAVLLKGIHLMDAVYGSPARRPLSDMDLLVRPEDAVRAVAALRDVGYTCDVHKAAFSVRADHEIRLTRSGVHDVALDLHLDLNRRTRHHWFPRKAVWERSREYRFEGEPARVLGSEDNLAFLCAHAVPHAFCQLIWLCDIAWLIRAGEIGAVELESIAGAAHARRAVWAGLFMAARLLGAPVDPALLSSLDPDRRYSAVLSSQLEAGRVFGNVYSTAASLRFRAALSDTRRDAAEVLVAAAWHRVGAVRRGPGGRGTRGRRE